MSYKVKQFWCNLDLNCPFAWKGDFLGKLTNAAIVYLLRPVMLQSLKIFLSIVQGMRYKVLQFWAQITDLLLKEIFFEKLTDVNFVYFVYPIKILQYQEKNR